MTLLEMSLKTVPCSELCTAISAFERSLTTVSSQMVLEMRWMSKLMSALVAHEPRLIQMNELVIVKAVITSKRCVANLTFVGLDSGVSSIVIY